MFTNPEKAWVPAGDVGHWKGWGRDTGDLDIWTVKRPGGHTVLVEGFVDEAQALGLVSRLHARCGVHQGWKASYSCVGTGGTLSESWHAIVVVVGDPRQSSSTYSDGSVRRWNGPVPVQVPGKGPPEPVRVDVGLGLEGVRGRLEGSVP